ncbi:pantoate--beta-alanine ligase [soil metagenome]
MQTVHQIASLRKTLQLWRTQKLCVALVPTMGNLHAGHMRLIEQANQTADRVIVSIFVNPLQFGPTEDFASYPRTLKADSLKLAEMGVQLLFAPDMNEMYPDAASDHTIVEIPKISQRLCGAFRPGHFRGVCTVVNKLFNIIQPDIALFGKKDYQQLAIIEQMVGDLCLPIEIVGIDIVRETDGLAMSSRNQYLGATERELAPLLYKRLGQLATEIKKGNQNYAQLSAQAMNDLTVAGFKPQYVAVCRRRDLELAGADDKELVVLAAVFLGHTRLIDNVAVDVV